MEDIRLLLDDDVVEKRQLYRNIKIMEEDRLQKLVTVYYPIGEKKRKHRKHLGWMKFVEIWEI